jgi:hypothetical protein
MANIFSSSSTAWVSIYKRRNYRKVLTNLSTVKPVYNGHPWDPKKVAVVKRWPLFKGSSYKTSMDLGCLGIRLAVVDRWPLFRGGR